MRTTVGQILINEALPSTLRNYTRKLDKRGIKQLLHDLYVVDSGKYREVAHRLSDIGRKVSYRQGHSVSLDSFRPTEQRNKLIADLRTKTAAIVSDFTLDDDQKKKKLVRLIGKHLPVLQEQLYESLKEKGNPFAAQVFSGSRGNRAQLNSMIGSSLLVADSTGAPLGIPVFNSFAEGLDPAEYWASAYGARKGLIDVKMATRDSGYLGKQLAQAAHRLVVTERDCGSSNGIVVDTDDDDNFGSILARDVGPYKAGTVLTPQKLKILEKTDKKIMVRSPITCQAKKGICQLCSGVRERGTLPPIGDAVGITAASALSEKLSQGSLSSKHAATGGAGTPTGFDYINQLVQIPQSYKSGAAHATEDGTVSRIENAPQGGTYIYVGNTSHYTPLGNQAVVKIGDRVEAGDILSTGIPNPSKIVRYKGIGEGRRYFAYLLRDAFKNSGQKANRRNTEMVARALINHVRVIEPDATQDMLPDDILEYNTMQRNYEPRYGTRNTGLKLARGKYLEQPALHYSIGTRVTPSVIKNLKDADYTKILVHDEPPAFEPEMHRALDVMGISPDWLIQQGGFNIRRRLLQSVHRGSRSDVGGTSFVPKLVTGVL